jgi:hypothetical protein
MESTAGMELPRQASRTVVAVLHGRLVLAAADDVHEDAGSV